MSLGPEPVLEGTVTRASPQTGALRVACAMCVRAPRRKAGALHQAWVGASRLASNRNQVRRSDSSIQFSSKLELAMSW